MPRTLSLWELKIWGDLKVGRSLEGRWGNTPPSKKKTSLRYYYYRWRSTSIVSRSSSSCSIFHPLPPPLRSKRGTSPEAGLESDGEQLCRRCRSHGAVHPSFFFISEQIEVDFESTRQVYEIPNHIHNPPPFFPLRTS